MQLVEHADVLEVVAEHACGTVADACALRGSCKGYRRAVDTTVRRLVYEDQPELRTSRDATLRVHRDSDHLDAVRIALTCDGFPRIARLVVVAFALDGAKDELHEGDACGPRLVASADRAGRLLEESKSSWVSFYRQPHAETNSPLSLERALVACLDDLCITTAASAEPTPSVGTDVGNRWPSLRHLEVCVTAPPLSALDVDFCFDVAPRIEHLFLSTVTGAMCPAIARCSRLVSLNVEEIEETDGGEHPISAALCDALIASGAPLESAIVYDMVESDARRLHDAFPKLQKLQTRWRCPQLPCATSACMTGPDDWVPSEHVTCILLASRQPVHVADLAAAYPQLATMEICALADHVDVRELRFPNTLRVLSLEGATGDLTTGVLSQLPRGLEELTLHALPNSSVSLLAPFATTLRFFSFDPIHTDFGEQTLAVVEAALSQLPALEDVNIFQLQTARCFLSGRHTRLRDLALDRLGVPLAAVAKACPRLKSVLAESKVWVGGEQQTPPPGWLVSDDDDDARFAVRCSFLRR